MWVQLSRKPKTKCVCANYLIANPQISSHLAAWSESQRNILIISIFKNKTKERERHKKQWPTKSY